MATKHLEGRVAIITGGTGGMGSQVAKYFAEQGAKVVVADTGGDVEGRSGMDASRVNAVVNDIKAKGGEAIGLVGDIANMEFGEKLVKTALDTYGKLDALVCAHGILRERMIFNMTEEDWDETVRVHLKGCFVPTKFASIYWRQTRQGGRIVYFTSDAGLRGEAGQPNYSAAHQGKVGLMRSTARALARYGVTCNVIGPGAATRMTDRTLDAMARINRGEPVPSTVAAGTARDPKNVAPMIAYLCSAEEGGKISHRVFGLTGHRITLWREPHWEKTLFWPEPFVDIDRLFELFPLTIGSAPIQPPGYEEFAAREGQRRPGQAEQPASGQRS
ncbi:MAG: SDR family NAD(P)-dependent oxidoreductase [Chloroflexi bacterium]|nr:SDR family NAD(P)-dependent oxidoreductase [Chloroflexota bacterium]